MAHDEERAPGVSRQPRRRSVTLCPLSRRGSRWARRPRGSGARSSRARARATRCISPRERVATARAVRRGRPARGGPGARLGARERTRRRSRGAGRCRGRRAAETGGSPGRRSPPSAGASGPGRPPASAATSTPSPRTTPRCRPLEPASTVSRDVLPDPDGPVTPTASPLAHAEARDPAPAGGCAPGPAVERPMSRATSAERPCPSSRRA